MKYLYLLGSVLRGHFDKNRRRFTLSAMLMFFFSSLLMLFVASVMGSDILWSKEDEEWADTAYVFYAVDQNGKQGLIDAREHIFDELFSLKSNGIDSIKISIFNSSESDEEVGNRSVKGIGILPVLKENRESGLLFDLDFKNSNWGYYFPTYQAEQNIKEGTEITLQQLENEENVVVLPEDCGVKVGEQVALFGESFSVVGITTDYFARMPSFALEKLALESDELKYHIREIDFKKPLDNKTYQTLKQAVYESTGKEISYYEGRSLPHDADMAFSLIMGVLGTIIALFSIFGIYYPTLRLCKETMPTLSVFKMCGMKMLPVFSLLALSVLMCYALSFGLASVVLIMTEGVFSSCITSYELKNLYFGLSAFLFIAVAAVAIAPQMIKMAKSQPAEEVEN